MRARPVVLLAAGLLVVTAACSDSSGAGGKSKVDTDAPATQLTAAVQEVQSGLPVDLPRSSVEVLLQDLCSLGPSGAASAVASQLAPLAVDLDQAHAVLAALDAGTGKLCPGSVDAAARSAAEAALAPATTTTAPPPVAASSGSRGPAGSGSSGSRSSSSKVTNGPATATGSIDSSTGSASAGGGNASGSGNQSSTSYSQDVSGVDGASNSSTASN
jgi:hypothetical protein